MSAPDPRLTLVRAGVAAARLEGVVQADRYAGTEVMQVLAPVAELRAGPEPKSEQLDQLLFGERFQVLERKGLRVFGQAERDGYVGWVRLERLGPFGPPPSHWVSVLRTVAFAEPSIKTPVRGRFSKNALVHVEGREGRFARIAGSGWITAEHLSPIGEWARDPAGVGLQYLGAPYVWGGRDSLGLDCSGLVQQALYACGMACPRDSDQQAGLGEPIDAGADLGGLRRNDLVFWRGHVGLMLDEARLLHANAHHMAVAIEPLAAAVARIRAAGAGEPVAFRRLGRFSEEPRAAAAPSHASQHERRADAIALQGVSKSFGGESAVGGVSLAVGKGEFLAVVGASGSGKSTLLKTVNRLIDPDAGEVRIGDRPVGSEPPHQLRRRIGYVFQGVGLFPHLTVSENIAVTPRLLGWPKRRIAERVEALLDLVRLPRDYGERPSGDLSGGERQRVGLARALAAEPEIMLLDEPFGALDAITRDALGRDYRRLHDELGLTTVMITHDMLEAVLLADRIAVMRDGRILAEGEPRELTGASADPYVRTLMETPRRQADIVAERVGPDG